MFPARSLLLLVLALPLGACTSLRKIGKTPTPAAAVYETTGVETGLASWYRDHRTASGERFSGMAMAAAHRRLPFGSKVRVIDLKTGRSIIVRINDRGPYIRGRIIDLTVTAARSLGIYHRGIARVRIEALKEIPVLKSPNLKLPRASGEASGTPARKPPAEPATAKIESFFKSLFKQPEARKESPPSIPQPPPPRRKARAA